MKSDCFIDRWICNMLNMENIFNFKLFHSSVHQKRSEPESSCVSMRSGETQTDLRYYILAKYMIKKRYCVC